MQFVPGARLQYRGLSWDVTGVAACGAQTRLRLRCAQGDMAGLEWDALHPWDALAPRDRSFRTDDPAAARDWWLYHVAHWLDQARGGQAVVASHPGRMAMEPWQLIPVLRALDMPRPRLLLADGVGLGKTVQAGLIAAELIQRRRAHRIIVVAPAGPLLAQWADELRTRFGLRPTVLADAGALRSARARQELGGNPFDAAALCLTSIDFAKQDAMLGELERSSWDLAIIDEAHHCFGDAAAPTHRRRLAEMLADRADGLLLLTATPHDGHDAHFASLIALLDPGLVDGDGRLLGQAYRRHVVRRLKSHIRDTVSGRALFRPRVIKPIAVGLSAAALRFHQALAELMAVRLRRAPGLRAAGSGDAGSRGPADTLAFVGLLKRSASTIAASIATLSVVADRYAAIDLAGADRKRERRRALAAYRRRVMRYGVLTAAEECEQAELEAEGMAAELRAAEPHEPGGENPATALRAIIRLGQAAASEDPKLRALADAIREIRTAEPDANILVYTEYADSQTAARAALGDDPALGTVLSISGADPDEARALAADRFAHETRLVLLSTDSLAEGLNLQRRCHHLIHLDLPYNPNRLEQRNGRIDRYGQTRDPEIRYPYLAGTFEERLLLRLIAKYERARAELEFMPNTLGVTADASALAPGLVEGFAEEQAQLFPTPSSAIRTLEPVVEASDAYRDLHREINRAYEGFEGVAVQHGWWAGAEPVAMRAPMRGDGPAPASFPGLTRGLEHAGGGGDPRQGFSGEANPWTTPDDATGAHDRDGNDAPASLSPVDFLTRAIAADNNTGNRPVAPDRRTRDLVCDLPRGWHVDLTGLPGFEPDGPRIRITTDQDRTRDAAGRTLACLGWTHPLIRFAAERWRAVPDGGPDPRVAVAQAKSRSPAALLTYALHIRAASRTIWRAVIAVRVGAGTEPAIVADPHGWLRADWPKSDQANDAWGRHFAYWLPACMESALALARQTAPAMADATLTAHVDMLTREAAQRDRWTERRVIGLCGPPLPPIADLFGDAPAIPAWKSASAPLTRLDSFIRDPATPLGPREDAITLRAVCRAHRHLLASQAAIEPPIVTPLGMLLLVPAGA